MTRHLQWCHECKWCAAMTCWWVTSGSSDTVDVSCLLHADRGGGVGGGEGEANRTHRSVWVWQDTNGVMSGNGVQQWLIDRSHQGHLIAVFVLCMQTWGGANTTQRSIRTHDNKITRELGGHARHKVVPCLKFQANTPLHTYKDTTWKVYTLLYSISKSIHFWESSFFKESKKWLYFCGRGKSKNIMADQKFKFW